MDTSLEGTGGQDVGGTGPPSPSAEPGTQAAFGEFLRQARERRQLTLQQISADTKIAARHLSALEHGNVDALPRGMYRRAMLRAYAESVGLDTVTAVEQFERTFEQPVGRPQPREAEKREAFGSPRVEPAARGRESVRRQQRDARLLLIAIVLAAVAVVALVTGDSNQQPVRAERDDPAEAVRTETPPPGEGAADSIGHASGTSTAASTAVPETVAPSETAPEPIPAGLRPAAALTPALEAVRATTGNQESRPDRPETPRATDGQLVIESAPSGARVTVNGTGWGLTPLTIRHLPFGSKRVRVTKDGYLSQERVIDLAAGQPNARLRFGLSAAN